MSHAFPKVISARLTNEQLSRVLRAANRSGLAPSAFVRGLMIKLADGATGTGDPQDAIDAVCRALSLPVDSDTAVIQAAFNALLGTLGDSEPPPADGSNEHADPVPPGPPGTPSLSAKCTKHGITEREFHETIASARARGAKTSAAPAKKRSITELRADRELAAKLKAKGLTLEQFEQLKSKAATRR